MTQRIFPMPKIEFSTNSAECMGFHFFIRDNVSCYVDCGIVGYPIIMAYESNQTFEQAVTEWVKNWVKDNFEGIVLPETAWSNEIGECVVLSELLELNPNCIKVEE